MLCLAQRGSFSLRLFFFFLVQRDKSLFENSVITEDFFRKDFKKNAFLSFHLDYGFSCL